MNSALPVVRRTSGSESAQQDVLRLAAIDVGSNSIHMIVAQVAQDGAITTLWRMKEMVGLGRLSFPSRKLTRAAMDSAIAALGRFQQAALQRGCEQVIAVATSAVREAENGGALIERAQRELGLTVHLVSAREEARLIYLAVRHAMPLRQRPHLIVDVGGGSVEFIVGNGTDAELLESRKLGAARLTAQFVRSDPISEKDLAALRKHFDAELSNLCPQIAALSPVGAIGTSATLENLAAMCRAMAPGAKGADANAAAAASSGAGGVSPGVIERESFEQMLNFLVKSTAKDRAKMPGLDDQRKDQILAGALLVDELFRRLNLARIELCPMALREGVLLDHLSRHLPELTVRREVPDPRRRSVIDLARRCDWHRKHSEQVAFLVLRLFDELKHLHELRPVERELIEYAALLHDIGWHIARKAHHKHSLYLILNGDLQDLDKDEVRIIANIARYHRKAMPKARHRRYAGLSTRGKRVVDVGAALLRLADGLDRSHCSVVKDLRCRVDPETGDIRCLVSAKMDAELELWGARRKRDLFHKVFERDIHFELQGK